MPLTPDQPDSAAMADVLQLAKSRGGFLTDLEVAIIAAHDRLRMILVRCGGCRFLCHAQDVKHLADIIAREKTDYVRDFSLPADDVVFKEPAPVVPLPARDMGQPWPTLNYSYEEDHSDADPGL